MIAGGRGGALARLSNRGYLQPYRSLRLAAQDVALSRRKQGFESPRERHDFNALADQIPSVSSWCLVCHADTTLIRRGTLFFLSARTHALSFFCTKCEKPEVLEVDQLSGLNVGEFEQITSLRAPRVIAT